MFFSKNAPRIARPDRVRVFKRYSKSRSAKFTRTYRGSGIGSETIAWSKLSVEFHDRNIVAGWIERGTKRICDSGNGVYVRVAKMRRTICDLFFLCFQDCKLRNRTAHAGYQFERIAINLGRYGGLFVELFERNPSYVVDVRFCGRLAGTFGSTRHNSERCKAPSHLSLSLNHFSQAQVDAQIDTLTSEQASSLVSNLNLSSIYTILQDTSKVPLSQVPGMDANSLQIFMVKLAATDASSLTEFLSTFASFIAD